MGIAVEYKIAATMVSILVEIMKRQILHRRKRLTLDFVFRGDQLERKLGVPEDDPERADPADTSALRHLDKRAVKVHRRDERTGRSRREKLAWWAIIMMRICIGIGRIVSLPVRLDVEDVAGVVDPHPPQRDIHVPLAVLTRNRVDAHGSLLPRRQRLRFSSPLVSPVPLSLGDAPLPDLSTPGPAVERGPLVGLCLVFLAILALSRRRVGNEEERPVRDFFGEQRRRRLGRMCEREEDVGRVARRVGEDVVPVGVSWWEGHYSDKQLMKKWDNKRGAKISGETLERTGRKRWNDAV